MAMHCHGTQYSTSQATTPVTTTYITKAGASRPTSHSLSSHSGIVYSAQYGAGTQRPAMSGVEQQRPPRKMHRRCSFQKSSHCSKSGFDSLRVCIIRHGNLHHIRGVCSGLDDGERSDPFILHGWQA